MHDQSILSPKKYKSTRHAIPHQINEKPCEFCGAIMTRPEGTPMGQFLRRKSCSEKCRFALMAKSQQLREVSKPCEHCGVLFDRRDGELAGNFRKRKTCSDQCRYAVMAQSRIAHRSYAEKKCANCGKSFAQRSDEYLSNFLRRRACSPECTRLLPRTKVVALFKICEICGGKYYRRDGEGASDWRRRTACSTACSRIARQRKQTMSHLRKPRTCVNCGEVFYQNQNEAISDFNKRKSCSKACRLQQMAISRKTNGVPMPAGEKWCSVCGIALEQWDHEPIAAFRVRLTCGGECAREQLKRTRRLNEQRRVPPKNCPICGSAFSCRDDEEVGEFLRRKTCSWGCQYQAAAITNLTGKDRVTPYPPEWTRAFVQSIRDRDNNECAFCGSSDRPNVHHVDYNKNNCTPRNLLTLCHSCHAKTNGGDRIQWTAKCNAILVERGVIDADEFAA